MSDQSRERDLVRAWVRRWWFWVALVVASFALGLVLAYPGMDSWDSWIHAGRGRWVVRKFLQPFFPDHQAKLIGIVPWYGPLWMIAVTVLSQTVAFLREPSWAYHAANFVAFPITLVLLYLGLARAGVRRATALLAAAACIGFIRWGGHALVNMVDSSNASAFVLTSLYLWVFLKEGSSEHGYSGPRLGLLGCLAVVPYLVRPPVPVHFVGLEIFLVAHALFVAKKAPLARRFLTPVVPLVVAAGFIFAIWPAIWDEGWIGWYRANLFFSDVPFEFSIRAFGQEFSSKTMTWWYGLVWLPLALHPLALAVALAGLVGYALSFGRGAFGARGGRGAGVRLPAQSFHLATPWGRFDLSLRRWWLLILLVGWAGIIVKKPPLYDEERHILFLLAMTLVFAVLGLEALAARVQVALAAVVVLGSLASYAAWGRYSYVYKSPVFPNIHADQFNGDYWGLCLAPTMRALPSVVPPESRILIVGPGATASAYQQRLREGLISKVEGYPRYSMGDDLDAPKPYYRIVINRYPNLEQVLAPDLASGRARIVWQNTMPPGDPACVIARYDR